VQAIHDQQCSAQQELCLVQVLMGFIQVLVLVSGVACLSWGVSSSCLSFCKICYAIASSPTPSIGGKWVAISIVTQSGAQDLEAALVLLQCLSLPFGLSYSDKMAYCSLLHSHTIQCKLLQALRLMLQQIPCSLGHYWIVTVTDQGEAERSLADLQGTTFHTQGLCNHHQKLCL